MELIKYFDNFQVIDDECVKRAIDTFGKKNVYDFLYNIESCIDKELIERVKDYLFCNNLIKEISYIEEELNSLIMRPSNNPDSTLDVTGAYFKEISKYPILSFDDQKKYCKDLQLGKNINILSEAYINGKKTSFVDLGKIFVSLHNNDTAHVILESLKSFHYLKENGCNEYVNYYLQLYDKLIKKLGYYPNRDELIKYFDEVDEYKLLKIEDSLDKITLLEEIRKYLKYSAAKEIMINCNLRLVVNIAKRYGNNFEIIDLINEGNLGLFEAVSRFDVSLGYHFSTYAFYWIRQRISRYVYNQASSIKVTENLKCQLNYFRKNLNILEQELKRKLSVNEIATYLKMPISKVIDYLSYSYTTVSLDELAFNDEGGITFGELLYDKDYDVEELGAQGVLKKDVSDMLSKLKPRESFVIKFRYGIGEAGDRVYTLQEISDVMGITRERVRQIEKEALTKLKCLSKTTPFIHLNEY